MNDYQFQPTPFNEITILAGFDLKPYLTKDESLKGLKENSEAYNSAFQQLSQSYDTHEKDIRGSGGEERIFVHLNNKKLVLVEKKCPVFSTYIKIVENSMERLKKPETDSELREKIAAKVDELAIKKIEEEEKKLNVLTRFFHKLGQLFSGHGFRTEGEHGKILATKIHDIEANIHVAKETEFIKTGFNSMKGETGREKEIKEKKEEIASYSKPVFEKILEKVIFNDSVQKKGYENSPGRTNRLTYCECMSEEKKKIFEEKLLLKDNWFETAFNVFGIPNEGKDVEPFVSDAMIGKIKSVEDLFSLIEKDNKLKQKFNERASHTPLMRVIIEKYIKQKLDQKDYNSISKLLEKVNINIFQECSVLKEEDINKINSNLKMNLEFFKEGDFKAPL